MPDEILAELYPSYYNDDDENLQGLSIIDIEGNDVSENSDWLARQLIDIAN